MSPTTKWFIGVLVTFGLGLWTGIALPLGDATTEPNRQAPNPSIESTATPYTCMQAVDIGTGVVGDGERALSAASDLIAALERGDPSTESQRQRFQSLRRGVTETTRTWVEAVNSCRGEGLRENVS